MTNRLKSKIKKKLNIDLLSEPIKKNEIQAIEKAKILFKSCMDESNFQKGIIYSSYKINKDYSLF